MPIVNGTTYDDTTPQAVIDVLERYRGSRLDARLKIVYGFPDTGQAWGTEAEAKRYGVQAFGCEGYVGRSTGPNKIPIILWNSRSIGGEGISDRVIVLIVKAKGGRTLYQHPNFHWKPEEA